MGEQRTLESTDGTTIGAYQAKPGSATAAGLVVIQEIFGVNRHIRNVTDRFAADGYLALAPAMFDRRQKNVQLGYTQEGIAQGRERTFTARTPPRRAAARGYISISPAASDAAITAQASIGRVS